MKFRALDLFCGAGGASMGLHRAGFDVTGVDIVPQKRYPFTFIEADALEVPLAGYDFVWASPPCQHYSTATSLSKTRNQHPDLVAATRSRIRQAPFYCIENVVGAPLRGTLMLCGLMFGLKTLRHRIFETNFLIWQPVHPRHLGTVHAGDYVACYGNGGGLNARRPHAHWIGNNTPENNRVAAWRTAMGIDWMTRKEISQAVPPAYATWIGRFAVMNLQSHGEIGQSAEEAEKGR
ncbi:MAG TPA: DNA cytosine methyltransferase [Planctomycetota bacterium]|nr:DNA cytosine methyltransferase [Planctomycetota bacterium]